MSMRRFRRICNLWRNNPRCHYCNRLTVLIFRPPGIGTNNFRFVDFEATIDHLHDRYGHRPQVHGEEVTVLACWSCNQLRDKHATADRPKEELWERSGSYPQGHPLAKPRQEGK
jgi:hypothetical protein